MREIKLIATDLDGTLVTPQEGISPGNLRALHRAAAKGIKVVLCTGRHPGMTAEVYQQLAIAHPAITANGALTVASIPGPSIQEQLMEDSLVEKVVELALKNGAGYTLYTRNMMVEHFIHKEYADFILSRQRGLAEIGFSVIHHGTPEEHLARVKGNTIKAVCYQLDPAHTPKMDQAVKQAALPGEVCTSWAGYYEINAPGVTKGQAIAALCQRFGITTDNVMALGDQCNDLSIFSCAGLKIAMGNAVDELKAVADWVSPHYMEDGVARAVERFCLEENNED